MTKSLFILTAACLVAGTALTAPAVARDRADRGDRSEMTANQMVNAGEARTARMKVDLRLTPEQEKNWPGFETAMRDMSKTRADRQIALRDSRPQDQQPNAKVPFDFIDQMTKQADAEIARANDWKTLAAAAQPLYVSLDETQKHRFAEILFRVDHDRDGNRGW